MSNRLDPDQALYFVGHDLGPICLQRLSALVGNANNKGADQPAHLHSMVCDINAFFICSLKSKMYLDFTERGLDIIL